MQGETKEKVISEEDGVEEGVEEGGSESASVSGATLVSGSATSDTISKVMVK